MDIPQTGTFGAGSQAGLSTNKGIQLGAALGTGWHLVAGCKWAYLGAALLVLLAYIVLAIIVALFAGTLGKENLILALVSGALNLVVAAVTTAGWLVMGINRARGADLNPAMVFAQRARWWKLALAMLLCGILIAIGCVLLIIPGLYLMVGYMFALPLIAERNMGVWEAMEASRRAVTKHWFVYFGWAVVVAVIVSISAVLFLVPLLWTLPWLYNSYGVLYRQTFES